MTGEGLSSAAVRVSGKPQVVRQGDRVRIEDRLDELEVLSIRRDLIELRLGGEVRRVGLEMVRLSRGMCCLQPQLS